MTTQRPRILLSEGSSLSARETITALGLAGHRVELVSAEPLCLGRFSRFVSRVHRAPASGADPDGYLAAVLEIVKTRSIDALLPVQEQAYLFAAARHKLPAGLGIALADFAGFEQVQSKAGLAELLTRLKVPQPATAVVRSAEEFATPSAVSLFRQGGLRHRKRRRVAHRRRSGARCAAAGSSGTMPSARTSAAGRGARHAGAHAGGVRSGSARRLPIYRQVAEGPGGGDVLKLSVVSDQVRDIVDRIGAALRLARRAVVRLYPRGCIRDALFHRCQSAPRGADECVAVRRRSAGCPAAEFRSAKIRRLQAEGRAGVLTRLGLMGLMDAARRRQRRRDVLSEMIRLASNSGRYRGTQEELVPLWTDPCCVIPLAVVAARLLRAPRAAAGLSDSTVAAYSLTPRAIHRLHAWQHSD